MVNSKDSDLDQLKSIGDDIVQKGRSSVVEPYEKQIFQRWDALEKKLTSIDEMLQMKLDEFDEKERHEEMLRVQAEKKRLVADEEVSLLNVFTYKQHDVIWNSIFDRLSLWRTESLLTILD